MVLPGPEQPLVDGVETHFRRGQHSHQVFFFHLQCRFFDRIIVGIPVFGPSALAARMEGSKAFSKAFMDRHSIPTAKFTVFQSSEFDRAKAYVQTCGFNVVLKASGLAAGKGVLIPASVDEAIAGLKEIMLDNVFGEAGPRLRHVDTSFLSNSSSFCPIYLRQRGRH